MGWAQGNRVSLGVTSRKNAESVVVLLIREEDDGHGEEAGERDSG
jgi:hypothetical protein